MSYEVFMHGQVLGSHIFKLKGEFVQPDSYSEISQKYFLPGGETGTAATVLSSFGVSVKIDGTHIGTEVAPLLKEFYKDKSVDLSSLFFDPDYAGLMDYVIVAGKERSPMGFFQSLYEPGAKHPWNRPKEDDIAACKVAAIDPCFIEATEEAAKLCVKHDKPYVAIDCHHESFLHQNSAINVVSRESIKGWIYPDKSMEEIYELLTSTTDGLVIITCGGDEMLYGRKGQPMKRKKPFSVEVKSSLGAGDTFKAGCVYGLLKGMEDDELVRFASACSGVAISRFPLPLNPPTLEDVRALMEKNK